MWEAVFEADVELDGDREGAEGEEETKQRTHEMMSGGERGNARY